MLQVPGIGPKNQKDDLQNQTPRINVVQLTTIFYKLQNSDHIQEYLSADIKKTMKIEPQ